MADRHNNVVVELIVVYCIQLLHDLECLAF